jgi:hypothetical protein
VTLAPELALDSLFSQQSQDVLQDTREETAPEDQNKDAALRSYAFPYTPTDAPYQAHPLGHVNIKDPKGAVLDLSHKFVYPPDALLLTLRRFLGLPVYVRPEKIDDTQWLKLLMVCLSVCLYVCMYRTCVNDSF